MIIPEYVKLKKLLQEKIDACSSRADPFFPMYHAMHVRVAAYLKEALESNELILATTLHPSWRLDYFQWAFGADLIEHKTARELIDMAFKDQKSKVENGNKATRQTDPNEDDEEEESGYRAHKKKYQKRTENELRDYFEGADEPSTAVEKDPHLALQWWKVQLSISLIKHSSNSR